MNDMTVEQIGGVTVRPLGDGDILRQAGIRDATAIHALVNDYAKQGLMLPKSLSQVLQYIRDFVIIERGGVLQACAALHVLWYDLAEVRSLAVQPERRGQGLGRQLVAALLEEAAVLGLEQVFALTYQDRFFAAQGFRMIDKADLPRKIWGDCIDCPHFPDCQEVAMLVDVPRGSAHPRSDGLRKALVGDVDEIINLINCHAAQGRMLARSRNHAYQNLRDFTVYVENGQVKACAALHVLWDDLAEVRAVAVAPERLRQGLGSLVVLALLNEGRALGLKDIFTFTYESAFFEHIGFQLVDKDTLPRKVWGECLDCPRFPNCDELAMSINLKV